MPYKTISELPATFDNLPDHAKKIAMNVINSALDNDATEESAFKQAWAAVKKSYKQDADGNWVALNEELQTININDVEILAVGTWNGKPSTKTYTRKSLDSIAKSFKELTSDKQLNYEPPIKLGHDDDQKLLQKDGYPSAGYVKAVKRVGDKLVANIKDVPKKIGDIVKARGYKTVSPEIYYDYEMGGNVYPLVLKAVSFLGGDIPAVKTIGDIIAQYEEEEKLSVVFYQMAEEKEIQHEESLDAKLNQVRDAFYSQKPEVDDDGAYLIREVYDDTIITDTPNGIYRMPYTVGEQGVIVFDFDKQVRVELTYTPVPETDKESENKKEERMLEELRELYGLTEDATEEQVLEVAKGIKIKADSAHVTLSEAEQVGRKVTDLETRLAERERDDIITKAINAGKLVPAQKKWAEEYALKDTKGFAAFIEAQPKVVSLAELGTSEEPAMELSATDRSVASQLGLAEENMAQERELETKEVR